MAVSCETESGRSALINWPSIDRPFRLTGADNASCCGARHGSNKQDMLGRYQLVISNLGPLWGIVVHLLPCLSPCPSGTSQPLHG